jgi:hypothetical protein
MDARQLGDIGWIEAPRKMVVGKELGVWSGKWKDGLSEEKFLASAPLQYEAFKKSVKRISPKVQKHVGTVVDGHKCSLSGLLGVAHHAGVIGVDSWVKDPDIRKRFKTTTETFKKTNGIF